MWGDGRYLGYEDHFASSVGHPSLGFHQWSGFGTDAFIGSSTSRIVWALNGRA